MSRPSVLDTNQWRREFQRLPEQDFLAGFVSDMETDGDQLGAQAMQSALSAAALTPALVRPFRSRKVPDSWPLRLAVMFLYPVARNYQLPGKHAFESGFTRPDDKEIRQAYEGVATAARELEDALEAFSNLTINVEAESLDNVTHGETTTSLQGGGISSALPVLRRQAEQGVAQRRYTGRNIHARPGAYPTYRVIVDVRRDSELLCGESLTYEAIAGIVNPTMAKNISADYVKNVFRKV